MVNIELIPEGLPVNAPGLRASRAGSPARRGLIMRGPSWPASAAIAARISRTEKPSPVPGSKAGGAILYKQFQRRQGRDKIGDTMRSIRQQPLGALELRGTDIRLIVMMTKTQRLQLRAGLLHAGR